MLISDLKKAKELSNSVKGLGRSSTPTKDVRAYYAEVAPPTDKLTAIIEPLIRHHVGLLQAPQLEITPEIVKKIVQAMHSLPEMDKLEVSKGIRNASSFIYNGTKYGTHEMMHGGSSASTTGTSVYGEVVAGSGTSWTLTHTPDSNTLRLFANGQRLAVTTDYTIVGVAITTISSWDAGTLLADYNWS